MKRFPHSLAGLALALAGLLGTPAVHAGNGVLDVTGVNSFFEIGNGNTVLYAEVDPFAEIVAISWDVEITANDPSWLSEVSFAATDLALTTGVVVTLGEGDDFSGTRRYTGRINLSASGQAFLAGEDGVIRVEFYEFFNDSEVAPDATWNFGTLTFEVAAVPEPASGLLLAAGFAGLALLKARRRAGAGGAQ
jgi:hypothetical protein